jgi:putative SOS response-associated peptidase YedK
MCGRIAVGFDSKLAKKTFSVDRVIKEFSPNYNMAPTMNIPVITAGSRLLDTFKWGLIPHWAKDKSIANKLINARGESITEKPSFREPFLNFRVLVLVSGFYEWRNKIPHYFTLKEKEIYALAGIASMWRSPKKEKIATVAIITTNANELVSNVHNRMPVILKEKDYDFWISPKNHNEEELLKLLMPFPASKMQQHSVSKIVNSPKNNTPEIIEPIKKEKENQSKLSF